MSNTKHELKGGIKMAKRIMKEDQMVDVIWGATLLGGGGGGSIQSGLDLLDKFKTDHPEKPIQITIYDTDEMNPNSYAAVTAGMGAPTAIKKIDFSAYAINAFAALQEMASKMDPPRSLKYSFAIELGGFNTFVPILISLVNKIPLIDGDGAGRAVPALNTLLLHINGCATSPLAMADGDNNKITIEMVNSYDAVLAEEIGRHICMAFNMMSGLSGWMVQRKDIKERLVCGSITLSEKVGQILRRCARKGDDVFAELTNKSIVECKKFCIGKVIKMETLVDKGFDCGKLVVVSNNDEWVVHFQNENLVVTKNGKPMMTVPDIICTYDAATGKPLTNADIYEGMDIVIGAIKVDNKWWKNPNMFGIWEPFLNRVGYTGENIPFKR